MRRWFAESGSTRRGFRRAGVRRGARTERAGVDREWKRRRMDLGPIDVDLLHHIFQVVSQGSDGGPVLDGVAVAGFLMKPTP